MGGEGHQLKLPLEKQAVMILLCAYFVDLDIYFLSVFNSARHTEEGQDCNLCPRAFGMQHRSVCKFIDCEWESCYLELGCLKR